MFAKKKTKIIIRIVIGIVLILAVVICVARCDRKQYVSIRIACQERDEPLNVDLAMAGYNCKSFSVGTDEIYWPIPYDGVKRRYGVFAYSVSRRAESEKDGVLITHHWIQYSSSDNFFVRFFHIYKSGRRGGRQRIGGERHWRIYIQLVYAKSGLGISLCYFTCNRLRSE